MITALLILAGIVVGFVVGVIAVIALSHLAVVLPW